MTDPADESSRLSDFAPHVLLTIPLVAFLWLYRFLPLQDYPDWLYQASLFSGLIAGHPLPGYSVRPLPVPNSAGTLVMGLLCLLFPAEVSGKIFLTITVLTFVAGSVYLVTALDRGAPNPLSYMPFLFAPNIFLLSGYIDYILSLGLLFVGVGYLIRTHRAAGQPSPPLLAALSLLIYFSHLLSYLSWLVALGAFLICEFDKTRAKQIALAVLPSFLMLAWYTLFRVMGHDVGLRVVLDRVLVRKTISGAKAFSLFVTTDLIPNGRGALKILAVANLFSAALVLLLGILWLRRLGAVWRRERFLLVSCLAYAIAFALAPAWIGGEWWPGDRFLYPAAWIVFTSVGAQVGHEASGAVKATVKWAILGLFAVQMVYLNWFAQAVSRELVREYVHLQESETATVDQLCDSYRQRLANSPAYGEHGASAASAPSTRPDEVRVPIIQPQYHLPYYLWIERAEPALIFPTGLLQYGAGRAGENQAVSYESMLNFGRRSLCERPAQRRPVTNR